MHDMTPTDRLTSAALSVSSVRKAFATRPILRKVDLAVPAGEAVCLCGANGAGKSTLLRIVAGLLRPDTGRVAVDGFDMRHRPEAARRQLGLIAHASMVYPELTVHENLVFAARLYGVSDGTERVEELLADTGLIPFAYDRAGVLSRGLLQRLAIARALVHRPVVLLADEPFTGLDADATDRLLAVFRRFVDAGGALLMATHDIRVGLVCCRRVVVLDRGILIFDAGTDQIDADRFADDYLSYARSMT